MKCLSPQAARFVMAVAALIGLFASAYLFYVYITGGPIACALVSGCDVVRSSAWATSFGLPRPFFGLLFYGVIFQLLVVRATLTTWKKELYIATLVFAVIGLIESVILFLVQWLDIKAFCVWCLVSGAAATVIFLTALNDRRMPAATDGVSNGRELRRYFYLLLGYVPIAVLLFWWLLRVAHV